MDTEILEQLELIRSYVFITMVVISIWALFKVLESVQNIFIGFKKAWDTAFENRMDKYLDLGNYEDVIKECEEVLEKYPNHVDATWFIAKAHFGKNNHDQSVMYFKRSVELVPSWKDTADEYIEILRQRLNIYDK